MEKVDPTTITELLVDCGFGLEHIYSGVYRDVYSIVGSDFVIKIPIDGSSLKHARDEASSWKKVQKSKHKLAAQARKHLPRPFLYFPRTGFTIMPKYVVSCAHTFDNEMNRINAIFKEVVCNGKKTGDIDLGKDKFDNYGIDKNGKLIVLDMGCFSKDWWDSVEEEGC
jgi:hypothetical protein